jgi:hypothetical protein
MNHPWDFVAAAYIVSAIGLVGVTAAALYSLRKWSARARALERS